MSHQHQHILKVSQTKTEGREKEILILLVSRHQQYLNEKKIFSCRFSFPHLYISFSFVDFIN